MRIIEFPKKSEWKNLFERPSFDSTALFGKVQKIMDAVREQGDEALRAYEKEFDKVDRAIDAEDA